MLIQKNDKIYLGGVVLCGVLEALFIVLQMYQISKIANAVFLQHTAVAALQEAFFQLVILMVLVVVFGKFGGNS